VDTRGSRIQGWAHDPLTGVPVTVVVFVDGQKIGATRADRYRRDLVSVTPDGCCAFEFSIPPALLDGTVREVEVRAEGASKPLTNGRFPIRLSNIHLEERVRSILRSGLWVLSGSKAGDAVKLSGWTIPPPGQADGQITVNGRAIALSESDGSSEWKSIAIPDMAIRKFTTTVSRDKESKDLHFSFGCERPFNALHDYYYPLFDIEMPEPERRLRVQGYDSEFDFNLGGYSTAVKLDEVAERFSGKPLAGIGPVLDWGCGCGRVARFVARSGANLFGVDIDKENALWCSQNVGGNFIGISANPPTPFADGFFGAIYGISVFTHLTQQAEKLWLRELYRIAKPGALLLLSVHGAVRAAQAGLLEHIMSPEFAAGFVDIGRNSDIDSVTSGSEYYRNVFHQPDYIRTIWGKYFEILAIEEGVIGNAHDLVVARKSVTEGKI
jgi:SAM-dependent methyltransferase